jgi:signal transduction histidine kinase
MLWTRKAPDLQEAASAPFEEAESAEYRGDLESAARSYRELQDSTDSSVRAGALLRLARVQRQQRQTEPALNVYKSLTAIRDIAFRGIPVDLWARREICRLLKDAGRMEQLRASADALEIEFLANRWTLDSDAWHQVSGEIEEWTGRSLAVSSERKALTSAAEWIWQSSDTGALSTSGHRSIPFENGSALTLLWRTQTRGNPLRQIEAVIIAPGAIQSWLDQALLVGSDKAGRATLLTDSGELLSGDPPDSTGTVRRTAAETELPWTLVLSANETSRAAANVDGRRQLLSFGLAAIILLLAGSCFFLWRVMGRELAVARLQAEFVGTVSHEFRTPLTSMRHITELLQEEDGLPPGPEQDERKTFYAALGRNAERLNRLVESLLDFSRMETGRKPWRMRSIDAGALAADVVSEFQKEVAAQGFRIELALDATSALSVLADPDALGHALWNLLDNAVKYSAGRNAVHVSVGREPRGIVIAVKDEGLGIPANEQREVFRKFVRGDEASTLGIKGTGLGLAIVSHIIEAHGGAIELESEKGKGSRFRLVLPPDGGRIREAEMQPRTATTPV